MTPRREPCASSSPEPSAWNCRASVATKPIWLRQIGAVVAQELLQGQVLRRFTAEELSFGGKTYEIGDITVLADGIKVELK